MALSEDALLKQVRDTMFNNLVSLFYMDNKQSPNQTVELMFSHFKFYWLRFKSLIIIII